MILFAHGARDPAWAEPFEQLRHAVKLRLPETPVELAYLEFMQPDLLAAAERLADAGASQIDIVPAFMAEGNHLKRDLPELVKTAEARYPQVVFKLRAALGESPSVREAMAEQIAAEAGTG